MYTIDFKYKQEDFLELSGVNPLTIFPDLEGLAEHLSYIRMLKSPQSIQFHTISLPVIFPLYLCDFDLLV
ncbi:hypothetical protein GCM10010911_58030 [Paenibacillus nasutitermitis]|uniref:Uncharacterized protein n=1 Tax=Paenibacillus nasutitermitis TaxID=1652958 RepID=A0A916ZED6_9BACL|nr:hypothetical protein GCM10010911_58030 [Paenibacillus nasutitermitis]